MTDYRTPCQKGDPEDWFIEKDGRQYPDQPLLDFSDFEPTYDHLNGFTEPPDEFEQAEHEAEAVKDAIIRRRHAKDACATDCYLRTQCLALALEGPQPIYGTWGGYYSEELREIVRLRAQQRAERAKRAAARAAEE